jgi:hypothetical protein
MGPKALGYGPIEFNFNGLFCNSGSGASPQVSSYVQVFRNGVVEAVCSWMNRGKALYGRMLDEELVKAARRNMKHQTLLGVGPPLFVAISAVSVKGFGIVCNFDPRSFDPSSINRIDQDVLLAPELQVEEEGVEIRTLLRPALDTIWQASGWPGSESYSQNGDWIS